MKSDWLPAMPLHVAIWSQIVMESELSWADQGKVVRLLANAWSRGDIPDRPKWASGAAWDAFCRLWPETMRHRQKAVASAEKNGARAKAAAEARWADAPSMLQASDDDAPSNASSNAQSRHPNPNPNPESSKKKIHRRGARLPDDVELTQEWREIAAAEGVPSAEVERVFREFAGYWRALPGQKACKLDWPLTWRNRCIALAPKLQSPAPREGPAWKNSRAPIAPTQHVPPPLPPDPEFERRYREQAQRRKAAGGGA